MGTLFLSGIYGVGKSTLAESLSIATNIPFYSAGDLISERNGEIYGANKVVSDKNMNQTVLAEQVSNLLLEKNRIILAGHFCIVNQFGQVDKLPEEVFEKIQIEKIILLEASANVIISHLVGRDGKDYPTTLIESMLAEERHCAQVTASRLSCPLIIHKMTYTPSDLDQLLNLI